MTDANPIQDPSDKLTSLYPVVAVEAPATTAEDFRRLFALETVFETDWYVHLKSADMQKQTGLIQSGHDSIPEGHRGDVHGALVTIETENAAALWAHAKDSLNILHPLTDEACGQGHFIAELSGGVLVDIVQLLSQD